MRRTGKLERREDGKIGDHVRQNWFPIQKWESFGTKKLRQTTLESKNHQSFPAMGFLPMCQDEPSKREEINDAETGSIEW